MPVKAFARAKLRLHPQVEAADRALPARAMAEHVLDAGGDLPRAVVCDDADVAAWARGRGALVVWEPGRGLNGAVEAGVEHLAAAGVARVIVAHADLPLARDLARVAAFAGVTLVPDHRDDGTNVIALPTGTGFSFSYGPGSFRRHGDEARRRLLPVRVMREPLLTHDIDVPDDLEQVTLPA